jgi:PAS domain S-box-containing protein
LSTLGRKDLTPLAASKEMLSILEHSERSTLVMDVNYRILWFNSSAARTMPRYFGEPLKAGYTYWDYVQNDEHLRFKRNFEQALNGRTVSVERRLEGVKGPDVWIDGRFSPLMGAHDKLVGVIYSYENITERKRNEEEAKYRNSVLKAIESNEAQGFILIDADDRIMSHNPFAEKLFPLWAEAQTKYGPRTRISDIVAPNWTDRMHGGLKVARNGGTVIVEFDCVGSAQRILEVRFCPVHARSDTSMVSLWVSDITEKRRSERDLLISEDNLRSVFNSSSQTFFLLDHELRILAFNDAASQHVSDTYGKKLRPGINAVEVTPAERVPQFLAEVERAFNGKKVEVEKHFNLAGRERWFERHINPIRNSDGVIDRIAMWSIDITERKRAEEALRESEERFRELAKIMPVGVYQCDRNGQTVYINERVRTMIPASTSELISGDWMMVIHPDDRERVRESWRSILRNKQPYQIEYRVIGKDGNVTYIFEQAIPLYNANEEYSGHIGSLIDLTEQHTNQQLRQQKEVAEYSLKFRSDFLASMSHEIRTPLTGVLAMSELLLGSGLKEEQRKHVESIYSASQDLRAIVNDVLHLAELEAGKVVLREESFDTDALLHSLSERFKAEADAKGITLLTENKAQGQSLLTDRRRLMQILGNLTRNAIKFTEKGMVRVVASCDGKGLLLEIHDTGVGIPSSELPKLFTDFSKLGHTTAQNMEGTGLGLSISRKLATMLGGEVGVESTYGEGSTFWLRLPTSVLQLPERQVEKLLQPTSLSNQQLKREVLLVEDNLINQAAFKAMLKKLGCRVTCASNGEQALNAFSNKSFDIIFMDVQMPIMDGITATERMRASGRELPPVIALSGNVLERDGNGRLKVPMDDLLVKPVVSADLSRILEEWAQRSS